MVKRLGKPSNLCQHEHADVKTEKTPVTDIKEEKTASPEVKPAPEIKTTPDGDAPLKLEFGS